MENRTLHIGQLISFILFKIYVSCFFRNFNGDLVLHSLKPIDCLFTYHNSLINKSAGRFYVSLNVVVFIREVSRLSQT